MFVSFFFIIHTVCITLINSCSFMNHVHFSINIFRLFCLINSVVFLTVWNRHFKKVPESHWRVYKNVTEVTKTRESVILKKDLLTRIIQFECTHRCSYKDYIFRKRTIHCFNDNLSLQHDLNIRSFGWYLPITARPHHFWCRNIRTTFFHGNIAQLHQFTHL